MDGGTTVRSQNGREVRSKVSGVRKHVVASPGEKSEQPFAVIIVQRWDKFVFAGAGAFVPSKSDIKFEVQDADKSVAKHS